MSGYDFQSREDRKKEWERMRQWEKDVDAYKAARKAGLQPDKSTKQAVEQAERRAEMEEKIRRDIEKGD